MRLFPWLLASAGEWLIIVGTLVAVARLHHHPAAYVLAGIVLGTRQHALAILGHEGAHFLICKPRWLNDLLAHVLCFLPLGASVGAYRVFHLEHHRKLGTAEDPEIVAKARMPGTWDLPRKSGAFTRDLLKDVTLLGLPEGQHIFAVLKPAGIRDALPVAAFWTAALALLWYAKILWVVPLWLVSAVTVHWAVFRIRIWLEHTGTTGTHRFHASWWQRWLLVPHNIWYHYEHHNSPGVPFSDLPRARALDTTTPIVAMSDLMRSYESYPAQSGAHAQQPAD